MAGHLGTCESIDEAATYLAELNLLASGLGLVAEALGIQPRGNKSEVTRQIINQAVGARVKYAGLRQA